MKKEADENIDQTASTQTARTEGTTSNRQTGLMQKTDPEMILLSSPTERAEPTGHGDAHDAGEDFPLPRLARLCLVEALQALVLERLHGRALHAVGHLNRRAQVASQGLLRPSLDYGERDLVRRLHADVLDGHARDSVQGLGKGGLSSACPSGSRNDPPARGPRDSQGCL